MKKIVLIGLFLAASNVFAQSAAVVLSTTNKVVAKSNSAERSISRGSSLEPGDAIITAAGALAAIKYSNGTLVYLGEKTSYKILAYAPKTSDVQIKAELNYGKLESKTSGKMKETLATPVMALSILGTEYSVYYDETSTTYVKVTSGLVEAGGISFGPGQIFIITPDGEIAPADNFPQPGVVNTAGGTSTSDTVNTSDNNTPPLVTLLGSVNTNTTQTIVDTSIVIPLEIICPPH